MKKIIEHIRPLEWARNPAKHASGFAPRFATELEAKATAERMAMIWFDWIGAE